MCSNWARNRPRRRWSIWLETDSRERSLLHPRLPSRPNGRPLAPCLRVEPWAWAASRRHRRPRRLNLAGWRRCWREGARRRFDCAHPRDSERQSHRPSSPPQPLLDVGALSVRGLRIADTGRTWWCNDGGGHFCNGATFLPARRELIVALLFYAGESWCDGWSSGSGGRGGD